MIEGEYEQQLANGRGDGGVVFALKNFGWTDRQEIQHSDAPSHPPAQININVTSSD